MHAPCAEGVCQLRSFQYDASSAWTRPLPESDGSYVYLESFDGHVLARFSVFGGQRLGMWTAAGGMIWNVPKDAAGALAGSVQGDLLINVLPWGGRNLLLRLNPKTGSLVRTYELREPGQGDFLPFSRTVLAQGRLFGLAVRGEGADAHHMVLGSAPFVG